MEVVDNENLVRIMTEILECLFESTLGMKKKIKNWQFNLLLRSAMISNTPDKEARPNFTKSKTVFKDEQRNNDLVDLNNNSINKTEATKPQPQRKAKFGPFETSFEEEEEVPNLPKCIQWDPFMKPFTNNPLDYFGHRSVVTFSKNFSSTK